MIRWMFACAAFALAACSVLPAKRPVALYALSQPVPQDSTRGRIDVRLAVARPQASGPLATAWILVRPVSGQIEVYPAAQWSEPLPGLVDNALVEAFEASGRFAGVERAASGLAHDVELATELRDFQIELEGGPVAVIRIKASLIDAARGEAVASRVFETRAPAAARDAAAAVTALDEALADALAQLVAWVVAGHQDVATGD
ncbi:MAG: ABC-type transport auxiliary lipoprotein family protein [Xanthomonadaceae bacterium]|nr:ABC-type transport auxiliary lipoprotein family protein [Xanthomonadaceae bacterium]